MASDEIEFRQPVHTDMIILIGVRVQGRAAGRNGAVDGVRTVSIAPHGHGPPMPTCLPHRPTTYTCECVERGESGEARPTVTVNRRAGAQMVRFLLPEKKGLPYSNVGKPE